MSERLVPMLVRLPPEIADDLDDISRRTRIRKSDLLRAAVADLVRRYDEHPAPPVVEPGDPPPDVTEMRPRPVFRRKLLTPEAP